MGFLYLYRFLNPFIRLFPFQISRIFKDVVNFYFVEISMQKALNLKGQ